MTIVVTDLQEIKKIHNLFHESLNKFLTDRISCRIGHPGGSFDDEVLYSSDLNLWVCAFKHQNRYWNGFGIGRPIDSNSNSIIGEINFPLKGINRRVAGAFALEENGNILVLHRGKIGGGRRGIGKTFFINNFRGDYVKALDGDRESEFFLVGELHSKLFHKQVANFINEIHRIKTLAIGRQTYNFNDLADFSYTDEHFGKTVTENREPIIIERTHGIVVNALARELRNRSLKIGNDRNRDLFIHNSRQITTLFEIKTSSSTQCLYSVIGQLLLYSVPILNPIKLIAVLPDKLSKTVTKRFSSLGINILYYKWDNDVPLFIDLDDRL